MIRIRLSAVGNSEDTLIASIRGELLSLAVKRALKNMVPENCDLGKFFVVLVNGLEISPDKWTSVELGIDDSVFIAPRLLGGDNSQLVKTAAIIAITYYTGGSLGAYDGTFTGGLIVAGVSIGSTLLLNSLIPPPVPAGLDLSGGGGGDLSSSQMYSFSGQSNSTKKLGTVPKVYGEHRVFPTIAANPYTDFETDPTTGATVQYLYAIYDFGMGPCKVRDIKIGDTPILSFSDAYYRLVDLNKPAVSEGVWDDDTLNYFTYYKGDIERETVSVALNDAESPSLPVSSYQATRNASPNNRSEGQEISLNFVFPTGLIAYNATGATTTRTVDLQIHFSKVGEDIWKPYNHTDYVSSFSQIGGDVAYTPTPITPLPWTDVYWTETEPRYYGTYYLGGVTHKFTRAIYGIPIGYTSLVMATDATLVGKRLRIFGDLIGNIISSTYHSPGYSTYYFDGATTRTYPLFSVEWDNTWTPVGVPTSVIDTGVKLTGESLTLATARISKADTNAVYATFKFTPKEIASFKVRVIRYQEFSSYTTTIRDDMTWSLITTRFDRIPIVTDKRHTFLELKIRATNQLSGTVQNLSAVCYSALDVYNGSAWVKQLTSNPAWVFCDLLTGEINKRPVDKTRLHLPSIVEWADYCDEVPTNPPSYTYVLPRFSCNFVLDYSPSLQSALNQVANAANASLNIIDGKYGVLLDTLKTVPVQIFTPRNSSGFSSSRSYSEKPNGVKVSFIDPNAEWEVRERVVYDTGFTAETALTFDEITAFATTNSEQAFRFGRYLLAQNRLRQETVRLTVDFEHLVCSRGDYVQITQDVMRVGGTPARVKSVSGSQVTIDDGIETGAFSYGFIYRNSTTGTIYTDTLTVIDSDTFDFDGANIPAVGDLVVIGVVDSIASDYIVKSIEPSDNLSASITLVEKADAIYTAESSDELPAYDPDISPDSNKDFVAPGEVVDLEVVDSYYECSSGSGLDYKVSLLWTPPVNAATELYEIWVDTGRGYNLETTTKEALYLYTVLRANLGVTHKFKVIAVSASGKKLDLGAVGEVTQLVSMKSTPPSDVTSLNIDITGEVIQLFWDKISDCSNNEYLLRYSPVDTGGWERSIPLMRVDRNTTTASTQGRVGTYLIKAIDFEGNESTNAAMAITTIPSLFNLNIISETTDFPTLPGVLDQVVSSGGVLVLDNTVVGGVDTSEYYSSGYYYYENFLDLGEIYTVRLQSLIQAEGFTQEDLMSNWTSLDTLDAMSHAGFSDWDVETQYRGTDRFNSMADWATLSSINPISEGNQDNFTEWRKFTIGDATARIFQFRLKLISNTVSISPRVFDGVIKADMPDRPASFDNISVSTSGRAFVYDPAFKGPGTTPNIQVSIDSASSGDYWTFDYKTLDGFFIRIFDETDSPVARTIDVAVKGYGRKASAII